MEKKVIEMIYAQVALSKDDFCNTQGTYEKKIKNICSLERILKNRFDESTKSLFDDYIKETMGLNAIENEHYFNTGLKLGFRLNRELSEEKIYVRCNE